MKKVVILTGSELRHTFLRMAIALAEDVEVVRTYCESTEKSLRSIIAAKGGGNAMTRHADARECSERDFFLALARHAPDRSNPIFIPKGDINLAKHKQAIIDLAPDLVVAYGCSLIREPLLSMFKGRFLNVHLGLSPYYRGSGTNFWPLVEDKPEFVGATFMHIDAGIDTGEVIHQIRAEVAPGDTPHSIGNRLIRDMADAYISVIRNFDALTPQPQISLPGGGCLYKRADFCEEAVERLYRQFADGLVERYLTELPTRHAAAPIVENPFLARGPDTA